MTPGWFLAVTATVAASGVLRHCIHLWGERARYRHEQALERQRHRYGLLVLRQPAAVEVKIVALLAAMPPAAAPPEPPPADEPAFPADGDEGPA